MTLAGRLTDPTRWAVPACPETPEVGRIWIMEHRVGRYPQELRERAVRMVAEVRPSYRSQWAAMKPEGSLIRATAVR
jgi:hypothetical protein